MKTTFTALLFWRDSWPHGAGQIGGSGAAAPRTLSDPTLQLRKPTICPQCSGTDIRLILYGCPNAEALGMIGGGEACLGCDAIDRWLPDWRCHDCGHEWFDPDDPAKQKLERLVERMLGPADEHMTLAA